MVMASWRIKVPRCDRSTKYLYISRVSLGLGGHLQNVLCIASNPWVNGISALQHAHDSLQIRPRGLTAFVQPIALA